MLKVLAIYQLVWNDFSILTTIRGLPETTSVPGTGATKPVSPGTWGDGAEKGSWNSAWQNLICSKLRATVSVPSLQLTLGPFPLPPRDTRRRLHRSSASLYTLYTCRSGFLWGSRGRRSTCMKERGGGGGGGNATQLKQETMFFNPSSFSFHETHPNHKLT